MTKNQNYIQGYADCIKDFENTLKQDKNIDLLAMFNAFILALYNLKINLQTLQDNIKKKILIFKRR